MIEQDNRPKEKSDTFEDRIEKLKSLLNQGETTPEKIKNSIETKLKKTKKKDKDSIIIMVTGDHNVISANGSKLHLNNKGKKNTLLSVIAVCTLFF